MSDEDLAKAARFAGFLNVDSYTQYLALVAAHDQLENKLNADSQNFQIECQKAEIDALKEKLSSAVNLRDEWQKRFDGQQVIIDSLRYQLGKMEDGRDTWQHEALRLASSSDSGAAR